MARYKPIGGETAFVNVVQFLFCLFNRKKKKKRKSAL